MQDSVSAVSVANDAPNKPKLSATTGDKGQD